MGLLSRKTKNVDFPFDKKNVERKEKTNIDNFAAGDYLDLDNKDENEKLHFCSYL